MVQGWEWIIARQAFYISSLFTIDCFGFGAARLRAVAPPGPSGYIIHGGQDGENI